MEKELAQLRSVVESVLPESLEIEEIDVIVGTLYEGQEPNFKVVICVRQKYEDPMGTAGWAHELTERVRALWNRDELYVEVREAAVSNVPE